MTKILEDVEIKVENDVAIAPYFRMDLEGVADLAEEVARFYGYDKLKTTLMRAETTVGVRTKEQNIIDKIKEVLVNSGLSEIYTYGFVSSEDLEKSNIDESLKKTAITVSKSIK